MNRFEKQVSRHEEGGLYADGIETLQVNVGLVCNQSCAHCHLSASPDSREVMEWSTMEKVIAVAKEVTPSLVDITGGAPELNPKLLQLVEALTGEGLAVQVRTNLTALIEDADEKLLLLLKEHKVRLVGSLPCYLEENVRAQRGEGVYEKSMEAIRLLNEIGYGVEEDLQLNLVYNPGGAFLPGNQAALEEAYRRELADRFQISFTNLLTITNMPIGRFGEILETEGRYEKYMKLLTDSFNKITVPGLMCRRQVSIGWDGTLYDCDFNLALNLVMNHGAPDHINRWDRNSIASRRIVTGTHCFGCTAGAGSSCGGALENS